MSVEHLAADVWGPTEGQTYSIVATTSGAVFAFDETWARRFVSLQADGTVHYLLSPNATGEVSLTGTSGIGAFLAPGERASFRLRSEGYLATKVSSGTALLRIWLSSGKP